MNVELQKMSGWLKSNKLSLNLTKTKWTLFHSLLWVKKRLIANDLSIPYIDDFETVRESVTKFLGIFIGKNLTWKYQIEHVCNKVFKSIGIMYKSRNILSKRLMKQLYFSFIQSYLSYENPIRIIYDKDRFAHTKPLFKHAKVLTVYEINVFQVLSLIFKCKNRAPPFGFHNLCILKPPSKYSLRTDNLLYIPWKRTKFDQFSIYSRGPYLWNKF